MKQVGAEAIYEKEITVKDAIYMVKARRKDLKSATA